MVRSDASPGAVDTEGDFELRFDLISLILREIVIETTTINADIIATTANVSLRGLFQLSTNCGSDVRIACGFSTVASVLAGRPYIEVDCANGEERSISASN